MSPPRVSPDRKVSTETLGIIICNSDDGLERDLACDLAAERREVERLTARCKALERKAADVCEAEHIAYGDWGDGPATMKDTADFANRHWPAIHVTVSSLRRVLAELEGDDGRTETK